MHYLQNPFLVLFTCSCHTFFTTKYPPINIVLLCKIIGLGASFYLITSISLLFVVNNEFQDFKTLPKIFQFSTLVFDPIADKLALQSICSTSQRNKLHSFISLQKVPCPRKENLYSLSQNDVICVKVNAQLRLVTPLKTNLQIYPVTSAICNNDARVRITFLFVFFKYSYFCCCCTYNTTKNTSTRNSSNRRRTNCHS